MPKRSAHSRQKAAKPRSADLTQTPDRNKTRPRNVPVSAQGGPLVPPVEPRQTSRTPPPKEVDVEFVEAGGIKHLTLNSVGTATLVYYEFPLLEAEARRAMEEVQQLREIKQPLSVEGLRKYGLVNKWADPKDKQDLINSHPGCPEARKWAIFAMAKRLQKNEETIRRYARGIGARTAGTFHRKK